MKSLKLIAVAVAALALVACQQGGAYGPKTGIGAAGGAAAGGLIAAAAGGGAAGIAAGVIGGGLLGGALGSYLDNQDRQYMASNYQRSLESAPAGQSTAWQNPDSGNSGTVTPTKTYQAADGTYCREYQQTINVGGEVERGFGRACRQPDGSWKLVE